MKYSTRRIFYHPSSKIVPKEVTVTEGFWTKIVSRQILEEEVPFTLAEVTQQVHDFVNEVGPERLINVCEYTTCLNRIGDDGTKWFVVWYWDKETQ